MLFINHFDTYLLKNVVDKFTMMRFIACAKVLLSTTLILLFPSCGNYNKNTQKNANSDSLVKAIGLVKQ